MQYVFLLIQLQICTTGSEYIVYLVCYIARRVRGRSEDVYSAMSPIFTLGGSYNIPDV